MRKHECSIFGHDSVPEPTYTLGSDLFDVEALCMEALMLTRNFERSMFVSAPNDMSNSDCRLSTFNLRHLEKLLLIPTLGKPLDEQRHCVKEMDTV